MLILKPLSIDWSVAGAKIPAVAFTALFRFNHPRTRTYVRLLGPCFKTGRRQPFRHRPRNAESGRKMSSTRGIHTPADELPFPEGRPRLPTDDDTQGERHQRQAAGNLAKPDWLHSLPFQQFQALLTLFSKSFSPFPHGTCLLSVSNQYLALDEIYHPLYAPIPRNATLRRYTVHGGLQMTNGTLTLVGALFQEAYICASVGGTSRDYNSRPEAPISMLSSSLFIRHYWGNPI
jgi:hypothetical protein